MLNCCVKSSQLSASQTFAHERRILGLSCRAVQPLYAPCDNEKKRRQSEDYGGLLHLPWAA